MSCTGTSSLPALSARTVDIQIAVEAFPYSDTVKADRFRYVAAPHITSLSTYNGHRGTRVTVR